MFMLHLLLMLSWVVLTGHYSPIDMIFGFTLSYIVLYLILGGNSDRKYFIQVPRLISLFFYFIRQMIISNVRVTVEVLVPAHGMRPAIIAVPLDLESPGQITLLANMITLTPGTLSVDVSDDRRVLYMHSMYLGDAPDEVRRQIKDGFERRIKEAFNP